MTNQNALILCTNYCDSMLSLKQKLVEITSDKTSGSLVLLEKLIGQFEVFFSQNIHRQMRNELPDFAGACFK